MHKYVMLGTRIPNVKLGRLRGGEVQVVTARNIFERRRSIVLGVPGAFTPGSTRQHVPEFIRNATRLKASGYGELICIVPNDPFVVQMWAEMIDPEEKLLFLSDGNLDFTRALGMSSHNRPLFLGQRSKRYLMTVDDGIITRLRSATGGVMAALPPILYADEEMTFL
jgi:peroxiredoxin